MYEKSRQKKSYFLQVLKDNIAYKYIVIYYDDQSLTHINTKGNTMLRKTSVRTNPKIMHFLGELGLNRASHQWFQREEADKTGCYLHCSVFKYGLYVKRILPYITLLLHVQSSKGQFIMLKDIVNCL